MDDQPLADIDARDRRMLLFLVSQVTSYSASLWQQQFLNPKSKI